MVEGSCKIFSLCFILDLTYLIVAQRASAHLVLNNLSPFEWPTRFDQRAINIGGTHLGWLLCHLLRWARSRMASYQAVQAVSHHQKKTPLLSIQRRLLIFKQFVYLGKVSKAPFWKWYAGPSRITSIEQWGSMQKPLHLVRTFSWLVFQLFLILNVACTYAFIFVFFLFRHLYVQLCVLDNTTLFPVALFSLRVFFFLGMNCVSKLLDKAV